MSSTLNLDQATIERIVRQIVLSQRPVAEQQVTPAGP